MDRSSTGQLLSLCAHPPLLLLLPSSRAGGGPSSTSNTSSSSSSSGIQAANGTQSGGGGGMAQPAIMGGENTAVGQWPTVVRFVASSGLGFCGG